MLIRPRLTDRVREGVRGPITCITAPAGYGKTALIDQWAAEHPGLPVLRLDYSHRLQRRAPRGSHLLADVHDAGEVVVVVDGVDAADTSGLEEDLEQVIRLAPPRLHLLVARRSRTPAALNARLMQAGATQLGADDLAFTAGEAAAVIRDQSGVELDEHDLSLLLDRTWGWPAGVVLAAAALASGDASDAVAEFSGEERHVAALLTDNVLQAMPERQCRFLVDTSVLDRLDGPSCVAVTGDPAAGVMLDALERQGAFIRRLDPCTASFECHPLFRQLLRRELRHSGPGAESAALVRAAHWHMSVDAPDEAARCLREADRPDLLLDLARRWGRARFEAGAPREVLCWLDGVPDDPRSYGVALMRAYVHTMLGETPRAAQLVDSVPRRLLAPGQLVAADALRATWVFFDGAPESSIRAADEVVAALPTVDPKTIPEVFDLTVPGSMRAMAEGAKAKALWCLGDVAAARAAFAELEPQADMYPPWRLHILSASALLEAWAGDLHAAADLARRAMRVASDAGLTHHPGTLDARLASAVVLRERRELSRASHALDAVADIAARTRRPTTAATLAVERGRWHLAAGTTDRGLAVIEQLRADEPTPPVAIADRLDAVTVRLLLAAGRTDRAQIVLARVRTPLPPALRPVAVQAALARRDLDAARDVLADWDGDGAGPGSLLEHDLWSAAVAFEDGDRRSAIREGWSVAARARSGGNLQIFLDGGAQTERLLRALLREPGTGFVLPLSRRERDAADPTAASLSEREREVVRYLPTSLSSADIARELYISINTLRTHLHAIYVKLDVHGRSEAIQRAQELGLA